MNFVNHSLLKPCHTVAEKCDCPENGETTATVAEFGDSRTFLRQCGQAFRQTVSVRSKMAAGVLLGAAKRCLSPAILNGPVLKHGCVAVTCTR